MYSNPSNGINQSDKSGTDQEYSTAVTTIGEGGNYWQLRYEKLLEDYNRLQQINQNLEDKLLTSVEDFEKKKQELVDNNEQVKSTLIADVKKLSSKLVDAKIKLNNLEERQPIFNLEAHSMKVTSNPIDMHMTETGEDDPNLV